jgi:hypothetical protein
VAETTIKRLLCCWFGRTGKVMGQVYQCWWRICREIHVFSRFEYRMFYVSYPFVTYLGARGSIVGLGTMLQAWRSRVRVPMRWNFFFQFTYSFQPHYGPGFDSAANRNEYQESSWGVKGGRRLRLTTLMSSVSRLSREDVGVSTTHNPMGLHGLLQGQLYLLCDLLVHSPSYFHNIVFKIIRYDRI